MISTLIGINLIRGEGTYLVQLSPGTWIFKKLGRDIYCEGIKVSNNNIELSEDQSLIGPHSETALLDFTKGRDSSSQIPAQPGERKAGH